MIDHPIFLESIKFIKNHLGSTGLDSLEQQVLERLIHSSGDFELTSLLSFSPNACDIGVLALKSGSIILTDTLMALSAVEPMAKRTMKNSVKCILDWAPENSPEDSSRTAIGMERAWLELASLNPQEKKLPVVLIGSSPTALEALLKTVKQGASPPSLIIGMPVGFIGVDSSKNNLEKSGLNYILIKGTRGGAGLAAASINALLRASVFQENTI